MFIIFFLDAANGPHADERTKSEPTPGDQLLPVLTVSWPELFTEAFLSESERGSES